MKKNYFALGFVIPLILAVIFAGFAIVFINMQTSLYDSEYKIFEFYLNDQNQIVLTLSNDEYRFSLSDSAKISNTIRSINRYLPNICIYAQKGYEFAKDACYDLLDDIIIIPLPN